MTHLATTLPDSAPLPRDLLTRVRAERRAADAAEVHILELGLEYARANPVLPGQEAWEPLSPPTWLDPGSEVAVERAEDLEWIGIPAVRWDAPAAFASANGMSTMAGKAMLRDVLVLVHRAPGVWTETLAGRVPAWRARKIAQTLLGQPDDVCAYLDRELAGRAGSVGQVTLDRLVDEAMLRLHAEQRELEQLEALDARHVNVDPASINHTGIGEMEARADWADLSAFDEALSALADAIKDDPDHQHESLDVRRSIALGILADPARAQALLSGDLDAKPSRTRDLTAVLHLTEANLLHLDPVVSDADQRAHLDQVIRDWVGRHDIALTVRPIRHCGGLAGGCADCPAHLDCLDHDRRALEAYVPAKTDREIVELRDRTCVHPWCQRPARLCDCDHITAFDRGGATCPRCNLAPLCRHHHRLKTLVDWRYWMVAPATYLWIDPHGLAYVRTRDGTRELE